MAIVEPVKTPRLNPEKYDPKELSLFFQEVSRRLSYLSGASNPVTGSVIPRWIGDYYFETSSGDWWRSTGIVAASWEQITFASGTVGDHGSLVGLGDDDHAQYLKEIATTTDNAIVRWDGAVGANLKNSGITIDNSDNIVPPTGGTKIGTAASQKIGFWNAAAVAQQTTGISPAAFVQNGGNAVNDASTFDGYTLLQVVKALRTIGVLA